LEAAEDGIWQKPETEVNYGGKELERGKVAFGSNFAVRTRFREAHAAGPMKTHLREAVRGKEG